MITNFRLKKSNSRFRKGNTETGENQLSKLSELLVTVITLSVTVWISVFKNSEAGQQLRNKGSKRN